MILCMYGHWDPLETEMNNVLSTPFVPVTAVHSAFGKIPNMEEAIKACPKEFFTDASPSSRAYRRLANDLFAHYAGWRSMTEKQITELNKVNDPARYTDEKWEYTIAWLRSLAPSHGDKVAVVAWCVSLTTTAPPLYTMQ